MIKNQKVIYQYLFINSTFKFKYVTGENVVKAISRLKNKRTYGLDKFSSFILKIAVPVISSSLAKIVNISLKQEYFQINGSMPGWHLFSREA